MIDPPAFTRTRIRALCERALEQSGAAGVLPTPLEAIQAAAGVRHRVTLGELPITSSATTGRVLGVMWFEEGALFVDANQSPARRHFTEAHETAHLVCPWHAPLLRLDTAEDLFGPMPRRLEAEANFGAGQLIFQGERFAIDARAEDVGLATPFALAEQYGSSRHAAAHHYAETHAAAVAMVVAGRWVDRMGALPVWHSVESEPFRRRFGRLAAALPPIQADAGPFAGAVESARRASQPLAIALSLPDRAGRRHQFTAEIFNNRHCHLVLVAERRAMATPCAA